MTNTSMTSREAFEKWADGLVCFAIENEEYIDPNTHLLWCLFKEKTQTIAELVKALEFYANLDWKENTEVWQLPAQQAIDKARE